MDGIGEFMVKGILAGFTLGAAFHIVAWALTRAVVLVGEMLNGD